MLRLRLYRHRMFAAGTTCLLIILLLKLYKEDLRELPDRWHFPLFNPEPASTLRSPTQIFTNDPAYDHSFHPIDDLISRSRIEVESLVRKREWNVSAAASTYRSRRGRHPPPNFDRWVDFAISHDCLIVEDFFDQIYRDIEPFWGLDAAITRNLAARLPNRIRVKNGKVTKSTNEWAFVNTYYDLLQEIEQYLPDVDIPINEMDEPRILLSWEDVNQLVSNSSQGNSESTYSQTPSSVGMEYTWLHEPPFWDIARNGCHPDLPGRTASLDTPFSRPPNFPTTWPAHTYDGYVSNWTIARDPCVHAYIPNIHGTFVEPISQSISTKLLPMFSGSKLALNNDILLPGAAYWHGDQRFSTKSSQIPWVKKRNEVLWRGSASGGRNTLHNWTRFQRHRLLSMLNGTHIEMALEDRTNGLRNQTKGSPQSEILNHTAGSPQNFPLPNQILYPLESFAKDLLPDWIRSLSNAAFTWLVCFPPTRNYACSYTGSWYRRGTEMPLHRMFKAKYLPDVDGNSFSGRYLAFLKSSSLPIKSTIYSEWHDDRLIAWRHFVPMDNSFMDFWAILEYFVSHDNAAQEIALEGQRWAEKVLRKEDMLAYVFRLILEYARVCDDLRNSTGWTNDQ